MYILATVMMGLRIGENGSAEANTINWPTKHSTHETHLPSNIMVGVITLCVRAVV